MGRKRRTRAATASRSVSETPQASWLHSRAIDLLAGCGAWSAPLLLLAYFLRAETNDSFSVAFYALALAVNYPHFMATVYRAYRSGDEFRKYRVFTLHLTVLMAAIAIATFSVHSLTRWLFTVYITWSPWHYSGQNFGLAMMFARRNGASPSRAERYALYAAFVASYLMIFLLFHTGRPQDPYLVSIGIPEGFSRLAAPSLFLISLCSGGWAIARMGGRTGARAILPSVMLFSTQMLWFAVPALVGVFFRAQIPQTRYSSGVLAVMHSAQYLWITSYYARRESIGAGTSQRWRLWRYYAALVIGGVALFVPGPWLASSILHHDFGESFLIFTALVNIHHFVLDGAIWKLRDRKIAALLIETKSRLGDALAAGTRTLEDKSPAVARKLMTFARPIAACGLLALAGVDQARFAFSLKSEDSQSLSKAAALNGYDSTVNIRLARLLPKNAGLDQKIAAWERAVRANPYKAESQNALARLLLQSERYEQAYEHYKQMTRYLSGDADAQVNLGLLADRFGDEEVAISAFKHACESDSKQKNPLLYLAEVYDKTARRNEAIEYYQRYLTALAGDLSGGDAQPKDILYVTLKLARNCAATNDFPAAAEYFKRTVSLAEEADEKVVAATAYVGLAQLYAAASQPPLAAQYYQRALELDRQSGDSKAEGMDWFNYGQFLLGVDSQKLRGYACLVKSEQLLKGESDARTQAVVTAKSQVEEWLGEQALAIQ